MEYNNNEASFLQAISDAGLGVPFIIPDGKIHRFRGEDDKSGSFNCWYVFFGPGGAFGSWKLGFTETWYNKSSASNSDRKRLSKQIKQTQQAQRKETENRQAGAVSKAKQLYESSPEAQKNHAYLVKKGINPQLIRQQGNRLLIPMYDGSQLCNIQQIWPDGKKRFLKGGKVTGCYTTLGDKPERMMLICEGYATGCSLHEKSGIPVVVAFNAGNLKTVAKALHRLFPHIEITIAADNDVKTPGNPGLTKGREAAGAIRASIIYPDFTGLPGTGTDFNDYFLLGGEL